MAKESKLFKVGLGVGNKCKVIEARSKFEAVGFFLLKCLIGSDREIDMDDVKVEKANILEIVMVGDTFKPEPTTLEEIHKGLGDHKVPCMVVGLVGCYDERICQD